MKRKQIKQFLKAYETKKYDQKQITSFPKTNKVIFQHANSSTNGSYTMLTGVIRHLQLRATKRTTKRGSKIIYYNSASQTFLQWNPLTLLVILRNSYLN